MARKKTSNAENFGWNLLSNHRNLLFMLGNGLITGPNGFEYEGESKYRKDIMALYHGFIPLFRHYIPEYARSVALEESGNLIPVAAILDMKDYSGEVHVLTGGKWELKPYAGITVETSLIAVPAPLPAAWITCIEFNTEKDRDSFQNAAEDFGNVDISGLRLSFRSAPADAYRSSLMDQKNSDSGTVTPLSETGEPDSQIDLLEKAQVLGGIAAMLYHLADNSDLGAEIFKKTREALLIPNSCHADSKFGVDDIIMRGIPYWIAGKAMPSADWGPTFFFGLLDHIIQSRRLYASKRLTSAAREYVCAQLNSADGSHYWPKGQKLLAELANPTLRLSELFKIYSGTVSHALLIFFLGDHCEYLLEFQSKNPRVDLTDADTIAAAMLFGAREGWSGLAKQYRRGLSEWVTTLMALKAHYPGKAAIRFNGQDFKPLREFFEGDAWDIHETRALEVVRKYKWKECLFTRIKVPKSYSVEDGYITLQGDTAAKVVVDKGKFLTKLQETSFDEKEKIREGLGIAK